MQDGLHHKWAKTLQAAEELPDGIERILGVCRLVLSLCTDTLRLSTASTDKPCSTLERHQLQQCNLGEHTKPVQQPVQTSESEILGFVSACRLSRTAGRAQVAGGFQLQCPHHLLAT